MQRTAFRAARLLDNSAQSFDDASSRLGGELWRGLSKQYFREMTAEGGLISYGVVTADSFERAAQFVDRTLRGAKPAELPVQATTKFELVINLKTAKALGLMVPDKLLTTAYELIE